MVGDKLFAANRPLWIASLDLSKAFDRINWDHFGKSLLEHGVSAHVVSILQLLYCEQTGGVKGTWGKVRVRSGQLARPDGSPVLGRKQLYTKKTLPARNEGHEL